jgi:hypothetical protein
MEMAVELLTAIDESATPALQLTGDNVLDVACSGCRRVAALGGTCR